MTTQNKVATRFTPEVQDAVIEGLEKGYTREHAGRLVGAGRDLVSKWVRKGQKGAEKYAEFASRVVEAEKKSQSILVGSHQDPRREGLASSRMAPRAPLRLLQAQEQDEPGGPTQAGRCRHSEG